MFLLNVRIDVLYMIERKSCRQADCIVRMLPIKTVTPVVLNHTVSHNNKSSSENTLTTQSNSDSNTFSTIKTVCHCDDPNFKLFREIQLDYHPIVIKKMINWYSLSLLTSKSVVFNKNVFILVHSLSFFLIPFSLFLTLYVL